MFKLRLIFITLAAFQGACANPIPQNVDGIAGPLASAVADFAGSLVGLSDDLLESQYWYCPIDDNNYDATGAGYRKREVNVPDLGSDSDQRVDVLRRQYWRYRYTPIDNTFGDAPRRWIPHA